MNYFLSISSAVLLLTSSLQAARTNEVTTPPSVPAKTEQPPSETNTLSKTRSKSEAKSAHPSGGTNTVSKTGSKSEAKPESKPATPATSEETPVKAVRNSSKSLDQKGKIEKLNAEAGTFTVEGKAFAFSKNGKVYIDNVRSSLSDLKVGDLVAVTYFEKSDGANNATQVVKGYPHKKRKKSTSSGTPPATPPTPSGDH